MKHFFCRNLVFRPTGSGCAIVVPLSINNYFTCYEMISLRHLNKYLGAYPIYFIAPKGSTIAYEHHKIIFFPRRFFGSAKSHGKLLLSIQFYKKFSAYKYILFYHLDSLVFSSNLDQWCDRDFDYVGAPWLQCKDSPWVTSARVGNGGFALLKIQKAVEILSKYYRKNPFIYGTSIIEVCWFILYLEKFIDYFNWMDQKLMTKVKNLRAYLEKKLPDQNNDIFWSDIANNFDPEFRVASFEDGIKFAFEVCPEDCFIANSYQLPFGCHAWNRYNKKFWEPHILKSM